jgi:hypothetical protein
LTHRASVPGLIVALLACTQMSCAYSASPALLPAHLKNVAIPVFENATTEYTIEQ